MVATQRCVRAVVASLDTKISLGNNELEQLQDVLDTVLVVCREALERNDRCWGGRFEPLVEQALQSEGLLPTTKNGSLRAHLCAFFSFVGDRQKNRHLLDERQILNPHCIWFETSRGSKGTTGLFKGACSSPRTVVQGVVGGREQEDIRQEQ
jgi:hypothetical protein